MKQTLFSSSQIENLNAFSSVSLSACLRGMEKRWKKKKKKRAFKQNKVILIQTRNEFL